MEVLPTIDALQWIARAGVEILADEKIPMPQLFLKTEALGVHVRAARRDRDHLALELPVEHPVRRGRARADGGQRRRPQAGVADAADRRADPQGVRARRRARGSGARRPWAGHAERRWSSRASGRCSSPARSRPGGAVGEACARRAEGVGARARRQGPDDRARRREPRARDRRRGLGRVRQRRPDLLGNRARVRGARGGRPLHRRGRRRAPGGCGSATRCSWDTEIGPMVSREQFEIVRELVDDAVARGAALRCGGAGRGARGLSTARSTRRPC